MTDETTLVETPVVTAFLRNRGEVLLLRRSDAVDTYPGHWGGVSGYAEGDPDAQVRTEIREETGLDDAAIRIVRSARPLRIDDPERGREWIVHPYLVETETRSVRLSDEHVEAAWLPPTVLLDESRDTVPCLWETYCRVAPTGRSIAADDEHGAATLSIRALEVLRDRAGTVFAERDADDPSTPAEWDELAALAARLLEVRPAMAVLRNRVNRAMAMAAGEERPPDASAVLRSTIATIDRAFAADEETATVAADHVEGTVMTLSWSATVLEALQIGDPTRLFVAESRPNREGIDLAESLVRGDGPPVTVHTDAAAAHLLSGASIDAVLVGADAILPDGSVVNKTGTRGVALAANRDGVPVWVVAATDKVATRQAHALESGPRSAVYDGDAELDVANPTFDVTPPGVVTGYLTECGSLTVDDVAEVADACRSDADWR